MTVTVVPVQSAFVAEVGDVDLSQPLDPADLDVIKGTFWTYAVLVFPDQILTRDQHLDIAKNFGPLESKLKVYREVSRKGTPVEIEDPRQIRSNFRRRLAAFNHGAPACVGTLEAARCRIWLRSCRLIALSFDARGGDGVIWA